MLHNGRSLHRTCKSKAEAQKIACEATAAATFKANFDADPNQEDYFDDVKGRLVKWINLNQQLGEIALPNGVSSISFLFSDGIQKYNGLCNTMKAMYTAGARTAPDSLVCTRNADGTTASNQAFQLQLTSGRLPNRETLVPATSTAFQLRTIGLQPSESRHFDHFHLKVPQ